MTTPGDHSRRAFLRTGLAVGVGGLLAGCTETTGSQPTTDATETTTREDTTQPGTTTSGSVPGSVGTELVASGFTAPLAVEFAPGDTTNAYVVDQTGLVYVAGPDGVREEPFLDVRDSMVDLQGYEERGLLGLAFHPNYRDNGRVFARYSATPGDETPDGYSHTFVLAEYSVTDGTADFQTEQRVLEIPEPQTNHNGGSVVFGPDGYLYVGTGDGGGGADTANGHVDDWYDGNPGGNGQDTDANLLGSVLRIDVDTTTGDGAYGIPQDNPLVGGPGLDEQYAWGFRNPWRMSFTDGTLYVADVGEHLYEEVNVVESGGNYGWNVREGTACFDTSNEQSPPDECPTETPDGNPLRDPVIQYEHGGGGVSGVAVIGGYQYTGDAVGGLGGAYVFGDWRSQGRLFVAQPQDGDGLWPTSVLSLQHAGDTPPGQYLLGIGRDHDDELYVATTDSATPTGDSGVVHRLTSTE